MPPKSTPTKKPAEQVIKDIRRATHRHFSAEDKIRIVLDGLRGEDSIAELCRKGGWQEAAGGRHRHGCVFDSAALEQMRQRLLSNN